MSSKLIPVCLLLLHPLNLISIAEENTTIDSLCDHNGICENGSSIMHFNASYENDYEDEELLLKNFLNISTSKSGPRGTTEPPVDFEPRVKTINQVTGLRACPCDLLPGLCDINCCCDDDCKEYHLASFSYCSDYIKDSKIYDHRYCYRKNFIKKNRTDFILERLAENLFCISYDNLPPIYSSISTIDIKNRKSFDEIFSGKTRFEWRQEETNRNIEKLKINFPYIHGDSLWSYDDKTFKTFNIPSTGFTEQCSHRKTLKYLENFKSFCLQTNLTNSNAFLSFETFANISLIANSIYIKNMSFKAQECPKNVCIPVEARFCENSLCNVTKLSKSSCIENVCKNIVKHVSYTIYHNGTMGIRKVKLKIEIGNVSRSYHQHFDVKYQWIEQINAKDIVERSGNPGYIAGKPIIIGTLVSSNITKNNMQSKVIINTNHSALTISMAGKNGECLDNEENQYVIGFGDDIKSKCTVSVATGNFSSKTCGQLQERIIKILFRDSLTNLSQIDSYKIYVSRSSNTSYNISSWIQIYLNKLPRSANGKIHFNEKISCSGLIKSLKIDILYSVLPKTDSKENYKIIGVGFTLDDDNNFYWDKCNYDRCIDTLNMELYTYVMFHDISTPSMYYYAGGPNLDISLPYDFFYPFLSGNTYSKANDISIIWNSNNSLIFYLFLCYLISMRD